MKILPGKKVIAIKAIKPKKAAGLPEVCADISSSGEVEVIV